jgi:hypothetical protein
LSATSSPRKKWWFQRSTRKIQNRVDFCLHNKVPVEEIGWDLFFSNYYSRTIEMSFLDQWINRVYHYMYKKTS